MGQVALAEEGQVIASEECVAGLVAAPDQRWMLQADQEERQENLLGKMRLSLPKKETRLGA
jgi:hypothetical protein